MKIMAEEERKAWESFTRTGKISAYMQYCAIRDHYIESGKSD